MAKKSQEPETPSTATTATAATDATGKKKGKGKGIKELPPEPEPEPEPEEIPEKEPDQYTETSYTSASFESLPPIPSDYKPKKKKKEKKPDELEAIASLFGFSDEGFFDAPAAVEEIVEEEETKKKKKGGGGGGKKKKKEEEKEVIELPEFKKPKNWKAMNAKMKKEWLEEQIANFLAEKEAERLAWIAGVKGRRDAFKQMQIDTEALDRERMLIRDETLAATVRMFNNNIQEKNVAEFKKQLQDEWKQYLKCDGLPDPRVVTQVSTFLNKWREDPECNPDTLDCKCIEVLPMLRLLEELVACTRFSEAKRRNYDEVRGYLRDQLSMTMDCAMYYLLRDVERRMTKNGLKIALYGREFKALKLNAWVAIRMPLRMITDHEPPPEALELDYPALGIQVKIPKTLDKSELVVRASRQTVDLYSELSRTFRPNREVPEEYLWDLYTLNVNEHDSTYKLRAEQNAIRDKFYGEKRARAKELENFIEANKYLPNKKEKEELEECQVAEPPEMTDPRIVVTQLRADTFTEYVTGCAHRLRPGEVDLRQYRVCSGVLRLDILQQPPQPKSMRNDVEITVLPCAGLRWVPYRVAYRPPAPPPPGVTRTPEEVEAEMKTVEAEYEKLAMVHIDLSPEVMWFEPPVVCQWNSDRTLWTTLYVNDVKYNEDKYTIQFRTGVLWPVGLATLKHSNHPYQYWEMKPDAKGKGVTLIVTGVHATVTWNILPRRVVLVWLQYAGAAALPALRGKKLSVKQMVMAMREASVDMFPEFDGHNYVEGSCQKEWSLEDHHYHAMGCLSRAYHFHWSRWNAAAGPRNIVMLVREAVDPKREASFSTMLATPLQCNLISCPETANEYNDTPVKGIKFYPDLMSLNNKYGSVDARRVSKNINVKLAETVYEFLREVKPCSFS